MGDNGTADVTELLSADDVNRTVARIAHQIIEKTAGQEILLLGIPSGGVPLAERLAASIKEFSGAGVPTGALDVTLYRDDLRGKPHRALLPTTIPTSGIDGATVILVDDVLYSGRTIRAALDALRDIGRPEQVQLAVFVHRLFLSMFSAIRADYVGKNLPTSRAEDVTVLFAEIDGRDAVTLTRTITDTTTQGEE
mgnify:CR=1 FL=1